MPDMVSVALIRFEPIRVTLDDYEAAAPSHTEVDAVLYRISLFYSKIKKNYILQL